MSNPKLTSQAEVLAWLEANHPDLHCGAELDRDWVWIFTDLRGDENQAKREALKEYGFKFAKKGHALPSGRQAFWAHHCTKPLPFRRRKSGPSPATETTEDPELSEAAAFFNA